MSHTHNAIIKLEEETTTLQRSDSLNPLANRIRAARKRVKGPAVVIEVDNTTDRDRLSLGAGSDSSHGSRKRRRDASEDEEEDQKPSKRRLSEQEIAQLEEEEEVVQSLIEDCDDGESECEDPVRTLVDVKVEPVPETNLTLWSKHLSAATKRSRVRAPSPDVVGVHGVSVGGKLLRLTGARRERLGYSPLEVRKVPSITAAPRKKTPAARRKPAKGRKRATSDRTYKFVPRA